MVKADISTWSVFITNGKNGFESLEELMGTNIYHFSREVDDWFIDVNFYYYVRVNVTYGIKKTAEYFRFRVLNSLPNIITTSVVLNPSSVFREEFFRLDLNVSDYEDNSNPADIDVFLTIENPDGQVISTINNIKIENPGDGTFKQRNMKIGAISPVGTYRATITAIDSDGGTDTFIKLFTVKNNPPVIHDFQINGYSLNESISVLYGEDLVFTFNVSDVEGIAFVTVALLNEENEWFNITRAYTNENMTITISSLELIKGSWYVYIFVIDTDGEITSLDTDYTLGPKEILIIADLLGVILPWVAFFIGIGLGIIFGILIGFIKRKKEISKTKPSEREISLKQTKEKKIVEQKPRKEEIKKPVSEKVSEKETKEEKLPQRKIKRKL